MRNRTKAVIACSVAAFGLVFSLLISQQGEGPIFEGKHLSTWVEIYGDTYSMHSGEAEDAIRSIGPPAIPYLIKWIQYEKVPIPYRTSLWPYENHRPKMERLFKLSGYNRAEGAKSAFELFQTNITSEAIAELARLADGPSPGTASRAIAVLWEIGPQARIVFDPILNNPKHLMHPNAVGFLAFNFRPCPSNTFYLPTLLKCANEPSPPFVPMVANMALARFREQPEVTLPALFTFLVSTNTETRSNIAVFLASFTNKQAVLPALSNLLSDIDSGVSNAAANSISKIQFGSPINSPPQ